MIVGNKDEFAVEFEVLIPVDQRWTYGKFCFWANGLMVGDNVDTSVDLRGCLNWLKDFVSLTLKPESAERRESALILDLEGRPARAEPPGIEPIVFEYDARNRPIRTTQGTRSVSRTYSADGYVESVTGADGTVRLSRDARRVGFRLCQRSFRHVS